MERIKGLNFYQKCILIFMAAMALVFAVIYPKTVSRVGFRYNDKILVPTEKSGSIVYSGKIKGELAEFIVSDNTVVFNYGDKSYGKYSLKEDQTAIPDERELKGEMTGIEIHNGEELIFRGGVLDFGDFCYLYNEDGTVHDFGITYVTSDGIERDEHGNEVDRMKPTASTIYKLLNDPELTHKGEAAAWFGAVFVCILNALSMLYADELFRLNLAFHIRNVDYAEASDWEIAGRYIGWISVTIMAMVIFIVGLQ